MGKGIGWKKAAPFQIIRNGKKKCSRCLIWRPIKMFTQIRHRQIKKWQSGFRSTCLLCYEAERVYNQRVERQEFVNAYGGKCKCCGIKEVELLTVEHIGGKSRIAKRLGTNFNGDNNVKGRKMIRWLKANGWPKDHFTVLCYNCNCVRKYGRPCPHDRQNHAKWLGNILLLAGKAS